MLTRRLYWPLLLIPVIATLLCLPLRPLWVDEIYQLQATRAQPFSQTVHQSLVAPGGMPLGYFAQWIWLKIAGFSVTQSRVPAALFGLGSAFLTAWIARRLNLSAVLSLLLSLTTPLLFRYSTEARPYSQGLFFSTLTTAIFLAWLVRPSRRKWLAYLLSCVAGVYSQPFSLFMPLAHAVYLSIAHRKRVLPIALAIFVAGLLYAPWFLISRQAILHEAWTNQLFFSWRQLSPLMVLREISGGGYLCSLTLLALAAIGVNRSRRIVLVCCIVIPVLLAVVADAAFNYFFAIRQLIFVLPPILLLATAGVEYLYHVRKPLAAVLTGIFFGAALVKDVRWQMDAKEDWQRAAARLKDRVGASGCVEFHPPRDAFAYYFFEPSLRSLTCNSQTRLEPAYVATSPYASPDERRAASGQDNVGGTLIGSR